MRPDLRSGRRDERGVVLPTRLMVLAISAVAVAGLAFVATNEPPKEATPVVAKPKTTPTPTPTATVKPKPLPPKVVPAETYVEVYNNSGISGLAGQVAGKAQGAGWNVVGSDNWYGTIEASTVYYPADLEPAAKQLARDLGIGRTKPAIAPMRLDRLTVILTRDYS